MQIKGMKEQVQGMNSGDDRRITILYMTFKPNSQQFALSPSHSLISVTGIRILCNSGIKKV
jgi:hypothetical protein